MVVTDKQTWRRKTRCSTEVAQRKMNMPINSGKRVESIDRVDRFSDESSRSTESTKVESIDRVGRFSVELSRFVRLDRFQGLIYYRVQTLSRVVMTMLRMRAPSHFFGQIWGSVGFCWSMYHWYCSEAVAHPSLCLHQALKGTFWTQLKPKWTYAVKVLIT